MLQRDPQDVAPVRTKPLPRKPRHTLVPLDGGDVANPRWTRDGASILYTHKEPDRDGVLHHDLFRWTPAQSKRVEAILLENVRFPQTFVRAWALERLGHRHLARRGGHRATPLFALVYGDGRWWGQPYHPMRGGPPFRTRPTRPTTSPSGPRLPDCRRGSARRSCSGTSPISRLRPRRK